MSNAATSKMKTATGTASNSVLHRARIQPVAEPVPVFIGPGLASVLRRLPRVLVVAVFFTAVFCDAWLCDDAFISFRTADNFVNGYGLTWNVQERVQTYTHPLWLFLFSAIYAITREPYYTGIFLSIVVSLAAVVCFAWKIARSTAGAVLGVLVLACSVAFVDYSTSGLENPLTHLILALFLWKFLVEETTDGASSLLKKGDRHLATTGICGNCACQSGASTLLQQAAEPYSKQRVDALPANSAGRRGLWRLFDLETRPFVLSLIAALAAVNRMDTILLYAPALACVLFTQRTWRCLWSIAVGMLPLALWIGFSLFYYGFAFPNSAYAKLYNGVATQALATQGCYYLWDSLRHDPITLVTIAGALCFACYGRRLKHLCVALGILFYLLYIVRIGGDFMSGRFLTAPLFAAVCLLGAIRWTSPMAWMPAGAVLVALVCLSSRPLTLKNDEFDLPPKQFVSKIAANRGICNECAFYYAGTGLLPALKKRDSEFPTCSWVATAKKVRAMTASQDERKVMATEGIGMFGYYAGPRVHIVDHFALTDAFLARLLPIQDPKWRVGHFKRAVPEGYMASLRTGENVLNEPGIAEYYDHLALITQGRLWESPRLAAIWNMNLGRYDRLLRPEQVQGI